MTPSLSLRASLLNIASWFTTEPETNSAWSHIRIERHSRSGLILVARKGNRLGIYLRDDTGAMFGNADSCLLRLPDSFLRLAASSSHGARVEIANGVAYVADKVDLRAPAMFSAEDFGDWRADFPKDADYIRRQAFDAEAEDLELIARTARNLAHAVVMHPREARRPRFRIQHAKDGVSVATFPRFKDACVLMRGSAHEPKPDSNVIHLVREAA